MPQRPNLSHASRSSSARSRNGGSSTTRASARKSSSRATSTKNPVAESTKGSGSTLGEIAEKAKVPAVAISAGLVGLAGGVALTARNSRKRILGVPMPTKTGAQAVSKNLANAAKNVESFGEGMGSLAAEVRRVRHGLAAADGDTQRHPSPIEVVLQGLTRRR